MKTYKKQGNNQWHYRETVKLTSPSRLKQPSEAIVNNIADTYKKRSRFKAVFGLE